MNLRKILGRPVTKESLDFLEDLGKLYPVATGKYWRNHPRCIHQEDLNKIFAGNFKSMAELKNEIAKNYLRVAGRIQGYISKENSILKLLMDQVPNHGDVEVIHENIKTFITYCLWYIRDENIFSTPCLTDWLPKETVGVRMASKDTKAFIKVLKEVRDDFQAEGWQFFQNEDGSFIAKNRKG